MKNIFAVLFSLFVLFVSAQENNIQQLFNEAENFDDVTQISISSAMFDMISSFDFGKDLESTKPLMDKMESLNILIFDKEDEQLNSSSQQLLNKLNSALSSSHLNELMRIKEHGDVITFYGTKNDKNVISNLCMKILSGDESLFMQLNGRFDADELNAALSKIK